jgi:KDO2-lipid IV(A) lauroyltransferase
VNGALKRHTSIPRRWTLHGLNTGGIFGFTYHGVRALPRSVSYAIGHVGSAIVARTQPKSTDALVHNLRAIWPDETDRFLRRRALEVYRSYTRDVIDFFRAIDSAEAGIQFDYSTAVVEAARRLHATGRGVLLMSAHFGNWEAGGLLARELGLPLTVVAMREPNPTVARIRDDIRRRLDIQTIEVRQSLDTPFQIRAALAANRFVAVLVDRHAGRDRVRVSLLGRQAYFLRTPFVMAALTGAPLAVCSIVRAAPARFAASLGPEITATDVTDRDGWIQNAAQTVADQIGAHIMERPECWYHFYRYWDAQVDNYVGLL